MKTMRHRIHRILIPCAAILALCVAACGKSEKAEQEPQHSTTAATPPSPTLLFIAAERANAGVYAYNTDSAVSKMVWSSKKQVILDFRYNESKTKALILTAGSAGKLGVFPYVKNIVMYVLDVATGEVSKSKALGSGLQATAQWQDSGIVRLVVNAIDKTIASYVEQRSMMISPAGKVLFEEKKVFDLGKDGYPLLPVSKPKTVAPAGGFSLNITELNEVFLRKPGKKQIKIIGASSFEVNQIEWTSDEKYVIISTLHLHPSNESLYDKNPKTGNIYVYSIEEETIVFQRDGGGYKNFMLMEPYLFFDDGFEESSSVNIFNLKTRKAQDTIKFKGGCGIRNIPVIPDYSA